MRSSILKIIGSIFITAFLSSCATTNLVDAWHNPDDILSKHHSKILLVYLSKHGTNSRIIEDAFANELKRKGVASEPAYSLFPDEKMVNKLPIEKWFEKSGADSVITMQMERIEKVTHHELDVFPGWNDCEPVLCEESLKNITYEIGRVHVKFFDRNSGKLLWTAILLTSEPNNTISVSKDLSTIVVNSLFKEGLI